LNETKLNFRREVEYEDGEIYAKKHNLCFFEVSAKTGENIQTAFLKLTEIILNKIENSEINPANEVCFLRR
jgi:GTPase SAR1 family protein